MKHSMRAPLAVALAQAALMTPIDTAFASGLPTPPEVWLPAPEVVAGLLIDLAPGEGQIIQVQGCDGEFCGNDTVYGGSCVGTNCGNDSVYGGGCVNDVCGGDSGYGGGCDSATCGNDSIYGGGCDGAACGNDSVYGSGDDDDDDDVSEPVVTVDGNLTQTGLPAATYLSRHNTDLISRAVASTNSTCTADIIPLEYRIDCTRVYYLSLANSLPDTGDYRPIKRALLDAAAKLDAIVTANVEPTKPKLTAPVGGRRDARRTRPIRAVKSASLPTATAQAVKVVEEAALVILRSGEDPARRAEHYEQISAAVESTLVILRSA